MQETGIEITAETEQTGEKGQKQREKEVEELRMFELKQQKKRESIRGISPLSLLIHTMFANGEIKCHIDSQIIFSSYKYLNFVIQIKPCILKRIV